MTVLVYDPYLVADDENGVAQVSTLDELLAGSDFVSLHARANRDNENLFGSDMFLKMRDGSYFINTARESLVDEDALDDALESGKLGGAALDVVRPGPSGRHRLLRHPNVVMTPHIGGNTHETLLQGSEMIVEELRRLARGEPLQHLVNPEVTTH
jgi:D-3-phosphoglycerate dehydrogenase